jgi:hypothetical protein
MGVPPCGSRFTLLPSFFFPFCMMENGWENTQRGIFPYVRPGQRKVFRLTRNAFVLPSLGGGWMSEEVNYSQYSFSSNLNPGFIYTQSYFHKLFTCNSTPLSVQNCQTESTITSDQAKPATSAALLLAFRYRLLPAETAIYRYRFATLCKDSLKAEPNTDECKYDLSTIRSRRSTIVRGQTKRPMQAGYLQR